MGKASLSILIIAALFASSCSKDRSNAVVPVNVNVADFAISQSDYPAKDASSVASYANVKAITLAFFDENGNQQYVNTQLRADASTYETFGNFSLNLPIGSYTMEVLGYANEQAATCNSMTEWVFTPDKVRETFAASQTVTIPNTTTPVDVSATLNRVVPRLEIITTDPVPEAVKGVRITYAAGGGGINPITGLSSTNAGYTYLIANPTTFEGISKLRSHLFIATDQQTMTVTLDALDADGNSVSHKVVPNAPFQRNKVTKLTGALYSADVTGNFTINTAWITDTNIVGF